MNRSVTEEPAVGRGSPPVGARLLNRILPVAAALVLLAVGVAYAVSVPPTPSAAERVSQLRVTASDAEQASLTTGDHAEFLADVLGLAVRGISADDAPLVSRTAVGSARCEPLVFLDAGRDSLWSTRAVALESTTPIEVVFVNGVRLSATPDESLDDFERLSGLAADCGGGASDLNGVARTTVGAGIPRLQASVTDGAAHRLVRHYLVGNAVFMMGVDETGADATDASRAILDDGEARLIAYVETRLAELEATAPQSGPAAGAPDATRSLSSPQQEP